MMFEKYMTSIVFKKGSEIVEFYFRVDHMHEKLIKALNVFDRFGIKLLSINSYVDYTFTPTLPRGGGGVFVFADFTNVNVKVEDFVRELESAINSEVYYSKSPVKGFMADELAFPIYIFPEIRSIILHEKGVQGMIKGLYEKLGDTAAVFLYHMAYSGGWFLGEYFSKKLGLRGRDLLVETLKFYQASGWGRVELVEYKPLLMRIVLRLYDSFECEAFRCSDRPASQFIRGHISGLISALLNSNIRVIETKCIAKGDDFCEFIAEKF